MKRYILFLIVFLLSACQSAPQVTVTSEVTVTLLLPTKTPIPAQTVIALENIPPGHLTSSIEKGYFPENSTAYLPKDYFLVFQTLSNLLLTPILGSDSTFVFVGTDEKTYAAPLERFIDPKSGEEFTLIENVDSDGIAHYQSADGMIDKWGVMSIWCRTVCVQAVSYNPEDEGQVSWLEINPSSGQLEGYFPVFHDEKPEWGSKSQHLEINGKVIWFKPALSKWTAPITGKYALWKMNEVMGLSYTPGIDNVEGIFTFVSDGVIQQALDKEIYWQPDFGGYIVNYDGIFVWDDKALEWIKAQQLADENVTNNEEIFFAGEKKFVLFDGSMRIVTSIEKDENVTKLSLSTDKNRKIFWDGQKWEVWYAEKDFKEIPLCESVYDVLTPTNELNPDHIIEVENLQAVANWIQTQLTEDMFDPSKLKLLSDVGMRSVYGVDGELLIPETNTAPNYKDPLTAPFLKSNPWCGAIDIDGLPYMVVFIPYYVNELSATEWPVLVGLFSFGTELRGARPRAIEIYTERMNVIPWIINENSISLALKFLDPLTGENFTRERMIEILDQMRKGDFSSAHGLVLYFDIAFFRSGAGWYE